MSSKDTPLGHSDVRGSRWPVSQELWDPETELLKNGGKSYAPNKKGMTTRETKIIPVNLNSIVRDF